MILTESLIPEVGPFYVIDGVVYPDSEPVRDIEVSPSGHKDSNNTHYDFWKFMQRLYPELRNIDYDYYPRGRVVYNSKEDTYNLFIDKCLNNMKDIRNIISELNLPMKKVKVDFDEHYQCYNCDADYVNISENYHDDDYLNSTENYFVGDFT